MEPCTWKATNIQLNILSYQRGHSSNKKFYSWEVPSILHQVIIPINHNKIHQSYTFLEHLPKLLHRPFSWPDLQTGTSLLSIPKHLKTSKQPQTTFPWNFPQKIHERERIFPKVSVNYSFLHSHSRISLSDQKLQKDINSWHIKPEINFELRSISMKMLTTPTTWMRKQHVTMTSLMQTFQNTQPTYYKINHIYSRN